jgi:hypothetical protein
MDFTQRFEAVLTPPQIEPHREAGRALREYHVQQEFSRLCAPSGCVSILARIPSAQ